MQFRTIWIGPAILVGALGAVGSSAQAQEPHIQNVAERSGLISRSLPMMQTNLPHDPDRDNFYGTRYGDFAIQGRYNGIRGGGMYGSVIPTTCTTCHTPFFRGAPGRSTAFCPNCQPKYKHPLGQVAQGLFHPFRPVGRYYQNGCYVPIYDLDPLVPGPGPDLWPFYHNGFSGG